MKALESKKMTVGEAALKVYQEIKSLEYEFDLDEQRELKEFALEYVDRNGGSEIVKNILTYVFDNYDDLKNLID